MAQITSILRNTPQLETCSSSLRPDGQAPARANFFSRRKGLSGLADVHDIQLRSRSSSERVGKLMLSAQLQTTRPLRCLPSNPSTRHLGALTAPAQQNAPRGTRTRAHALKDAAAFLTPAAASVVLEQQDIVVGIFAVALAVVWVKVWDELASRNVVDSKLSRKLVHITTGLLFMLCWPFFSNSVEARYLAAAAPVANIIRLTLLGLGITKNDAVVKAVSREGNASELLRGPLYYVVTIAFVTIFFWRNSPIGAMALTMMCGGDGIADIVGRRWGGEKLPWNPSKSWAGSIAMFVLGSLVSIGFVYGFCKLGFFSCAWWSFSSCLTICAVALGATIVESLPISNKLDDNFTVPLTTILLGLLLMPKV